MRRHPTEPDRTDDRRKLAMIAYQDAKARILRGSPVPPVINCMMYWLGYRKWMLKADGITPPETPRRREKFFDDLKRAGWDAPKREYVRSLILSLGWSRPPDRRCEALHEHLDRYCEVDGKTVKWGLKPTLERDLVFHMRYDIVRLRIMDGATEVFEVTKRPKDDGWDFEESFESLGLNDDEYRFEFWCLHSAGGSRSRHPFDFAEVAGEWTRLEFQGHDWDGELDGSQRSHAPADAPTEDAPPESAAAEIDHSPDSAAAPTPDARLVEEAWTNFKRRHGPSGGGADWFMWLTAVGESPEWLADGPPPESTNLVKHLESRARLWSGWLPFIAELKRVKP